MQFLGVGLLLAVAAVACTLFALLASPVARLPRARRQAPGVDQASALTSFSDRVVATVDRVLRRRGWMPFSAAEIELAGLRTSVASLVVVVLSLSVTALFVGSLVGPVFGVVLAGLVPLATKVVLRVLAGRRRKGFAEQLDETLQMLASALRAGHSLPRALDVVAQEAETPTAEELARIVNENRLGRDLVDALTQTADRMESQDFRWVAEAVAVHRDTGGNLNEVLDRVGETIRERGEVRAKIAALASEGKLSGMVLMGLPIVVGGAYSLMNPGYMTPLFTTSTGHILVGISVGLFVAGGLWMRNVVTVKF